MKYIFNETVTYAVEADSLDEAEMKIGSEDCSFYEVRREMDFVHTEGD